MKSYLRFSVLLLTCFWAKALPALSLDYVFQHYGDEKNVSSDSQILRTAHSFYLVNDIRFQSTFEAQYQYDDFDKLDVNDNSLSNEHSHSFSGSWTQGLAQGLDLIASVGGGLSSEGNSVQYGGEIKKSFFLDNTQLGMGIDRATGSKASELIIARDLRPLTTAPDYKSISFHSSWTQTWTPSTLSRATYRYSLATEEADLQQSSLRIHQAFPIRGALQVEYAYSFNVGKIPNQSQIGRVDAHGIEAKWKQQIGRHILAGLGYRFYREENRTVNGSSQILGSDLISLEWEQEIPKLVEALNLNSQVKNLKVLGNLYRYLSNQENSGWAFSLGTRCLF